MRAILILVGLLAAWPASAADELAGSQPVAIVGYRGHAMKPFTVFFEGPTVTNDRKARYYHAKVDGMHWIYRVSRP
jgi:hypothetical protein